MHVHRVNIKNGILNTKNYFQKTSTQHSGIFQVKLKYELDKMWLGKLLFYLQNVNLLYSTRTTTDFIV